jgi:hypothetical protein
LASRIVGEDNESTMRTYFLSMDKSSPLSLGCSVTFNSWNFYYDTYPDLLVLLKSEQYLLIIDGIITKNTKTIDFDELVAKVESGMYLGSEYNGQFNIILVKKESILILTDLININKIYYTINRGFLELSNNLNLFNCLSIERRGDKQNYLDYIGLFQLLTSPYTNLFERTPLLGIKCVLNGIYLHYSNDNLEFKILDKDYTTLGKNKPITEEIQKKLVENIELYTNFYNKFILPVSGGVDSRITLYSALAIKDKNQIIAFTHGEEDDIEVGIAKKVTKKLCIPHFRMSIRGLYPGLNDISNILSTGLNLLLGKWIPVIEYLNSYKVDSKSLILIGDVLDLLRAKNIKSIRSRKNRILLQLGLKKIKPNHYSVKQAIEKINNSYIVSLNQTTELYSKLSKLSGIQSEDLIKFSLEDIENTHFHIMSLYNPEDGYQYEEVFNLFVWGRGSMGNQSRLINQNIPCYVISANRNYVKYVLNISQFLRFEDKLVHKILKNSKLAKFPTNQIPFLPYSSPLFLKYVFWATRSYLDQLIMKVAKKYKWNKNRLIKTENWQTIYFDSMNKSNYESYFIGVEEYFDYPIALYRRRADGTRRALSEIDLTATIVPAYLVRTSLSNI